MSQPQAITPNASSKKRKAAELMDIASKLNFTPGTRLQVKWTISDDDNEDTPSDAAAAGGSTNKTSMVWWTATLKQKTSETHTLTPEESDEVDLDDRLTLPIYELDYDPLPEMGFDERALEQVAFVSDKTLLNLNSDEIMIYRRFGEDSPPPSPTQEERYLNADGMSSLMDEIMARSMEKVMKRKMNSLPMSVQQEIAEKMKKAKDDLYGRLMERVQGDGVEVVTGDLVRSVVSEMK